VASRKDVLWNERSNQSDKDKNYGQEGIETMIAELNTVKLKLHGTVFRVASSRHPREDVRNKSCVSGDFPVQFATRFYLIGRSAAV